MLNTIKIQEYRPVRVVWKQIAMNATITMVHVNGVLMDLLLTRRLGYVLTRQ